MKRTKQIEIEAALRAHTLSKKKGFTGTMKPMSAHDEKTLDTAVALANEITSRSMNDLESEPKPPTPSEKSKFPFKFPLVSSLHHAANVDPEKEIADKAERRNFSEEAKSVPDIQATITKESKLAYENLIEKPTPSILISHDHDFPESEIRNSTIPTSRQRQNTAQFRSLQKQIPYETRCINAELTAAFSEDDNTNQLPLPPRGSKPLLVDKPRHFRRYPLKLPNDNVDIDIPPQSPPPPSPPPTIYQNTLGWSNQSSTSDITTLECKVPTAVNAGFDVFDGAGPGKAQNNPFRVRARSVNDPDRRPDNPFVVYLDDDIIHHMLTSDEDTDEEDNFLRGLERMSMRKEHVSVEDLLQFANCIPTARQRGVESDEVRIMMKVLQNEVSSEECLEALDSSGWNVHVAIKLIRVKKAVGDATVLFEDCCRALENSDGDIVGASSFLLSRNKNNE